MPMHIVYINLDTRPDRKIHCEHELGKLDLESKEIVRLSAVSLPDRRVGCSMSHLRALRMARDRGWDRVMIVEDDICFTQPQWFSAALRRALDGEIGFDVLLLAGNLATHLHGQRYVTPIAALDSEAQLCRVERCWTTTGYVVNSHYYDRLIDNVSDGIKHLLTSPHLGARFCIDVYWQHLMQSDEFLMIFPRTVSQLKSYSDIERKIIDYDWLMLDSFPCSPQSTHPAAHPPAYAAGLSLDATIQPAPPLDQPSETDLPAHRVD